MTPFRDDRKRTLRQAFAGAGKRRDKANWITFFDSQYFIHRAEREKTFSP
jgi:hypothetical protein